MTKLEPCFTTQSPVLAKHFVFPAYTYTNQRGTDMEHRRVCVLCSAHHIVHRPAASELTDRSNRMPCSSAVWESVTVDRERNVHTMLTFYTCHIPTKEYGNALNVPYSRGAHHYGITRRHNDALGLRGRLNLLLTLFLLLSLLPGPGFLLRHCAKGLTTHVRSKVKDILNSAY